MTDEPKDLDPSIRVSLAIREAVKATVRDDDGVVVMGGDDVILGMIDALADRIARSPYVGTIRDRRMYLDEIRAALDKQVKTYQEAERNRLVTPPAKPSLIILDGGRS